MSWYTLESKHFRFTPNEIGHLFYMMLLAEAIKMGRTVQHAWRRGRLTSSMKLDEELAALGLRTVLRLDRVHRLAVSEAGFVEICTEGRQAHSTNPTGAFVRLTTYALSGEPQLVQGMRARCHPLILADRVDQQRRIYVLARGARGGVEYVPAGLAGLPLERGNYAPDVLEGFDRIVAELRQNEPFGRFVLVEGPPGVGKSYLVRGLIQETPGYHVLVPPDMLGVLGTPDLVGTLVEESGRPATFIVEDADHALLPRATDNLGPLSALLNLGDGILGSVLNVRVIATTNAKKQEIEAALLRPGRLLGRIELGPLHGTQAMQVYERLTGEKTEYLAARTLAQVYEQAQPVLMAAPSGNESGPDCYEDTAQYMHHSRRLRRTPLDLDDHSAEGGSPGPSDE